MRHGNYAARYHVINLFGGAQCGDRRELDDIEQVPLYDVPMGLRCAAPGCAMHWPATARRTRRW